jgi:hypothetical protein
VEKGQEKLQFGIYWHIHVNKAAQDKVAQEQAVGCEKAKYL